MKPRVTNTAAEYFYSTGEHNLQEILPTKLFHMEHVTEVHFIDK